jgi:hypothetical protein
VRAFIRWNLYHREMVSNFSHFVIDIWKGGCSGVNAVPIVLMCNPYASNALKVYSDLETCHPFM